MQLGVVGSLASILPSLSGCAPREVEWSPLEVGGKEGGGSVLSTTIGPGLADKTSPTHPVVDTDTSLSVAGPHQCTDTAAVCAVWPPCLRASLACHG